MPSHLKPTCDRSLVEFKVCYQVLEMLVDVDVGSLKFVTTNINCIRCLVAQSLFPGARDVGRLQKNLQASLSRGGSHSNGFTCSTLIKTKTKTKTNTDLQVSLSMGGSLFQLLKENGKVSSTIKWILYRF